VVPNETPSRRRTRRTATDFPATVIIPGGELILPGTALDVSAGGIRVATSSDLPAGQKIALRFTLPRDDREVLAIGRIVLSYFEAQQKHYLHGVAFTQISPEDQARIAKFVDASPEKA
jgi:c-di-GMP-binding flagellar brake protein YcgR